MKIPFTLWMNIWNFNNVKYIYILFGLNITGQCPRLYILLHCHLEQLLEHVILAYFFDFPRHIIFEITTSSWIN
jgi:hypothetical protein